MAIDFRALNGGGADASSLLAGSWLYEADRRISSLLSLQENWDRMGAPSIRFEGESAEAAEKLLFLSAAASLPIPNVVPTTEGGITFEWHAGPTSLEVAPLPTGRFSWYFVEDESEDGKETEIELFSPRMLDSLQRMSQAIVNARANKPTSAQ